MATEYNPRIVTDNLVFYVDAANSKSFPTTGGSPDGTTWIDMMGTNNGTLENGPTFSSDNGGSIVFDGTNDYVECGSILSQTAYTKSAWFNPESATKNIVSAGSGGGHAFWMQGTNNSLRAGHQGTWDRVSYTLPSGNMLNQWWNGAVTWNNSTGWVLYLNGDQVDTDSDTTGPLSATVKIAAYGTGNYFDGTIAQVSIYDRVITAAEVKQNFDATKTRFGL